MTEVDPAPDAGFVRDPQSSVSPLRRFIQQVAIVLAWAVTLVLTGPLVGTSLDWHRQWVVIAGAVAPLLTAIAVVCFTTALAVRHRTLAIFLGAVVAGHLAWLAPELETGATPAAVASDGRRVSLYNHNLLWDNESIDSAGREITAANADFVFLQELSVTNWQALQASNVLAAYPYSMVAPVESPSGIGLWSKFPLRSPTIVKSSRSGFPSIRAEADVAGRVVALWNVHPAAPVDDPPTTWRIGLEELHEDLRAETGDVIVAGDFNATSAHRPFRRILADDYRDAHVEDRRPWARTWPATGSSLGAFGPLVRLDHVLLRGHLRTKDIREGRSSGSDHRPLVAEITLTA